MRLTPRTLQEKTIRCSIVMAIKIEIGGMLGQFSKFSPDTLKGYLTLSGANARTTVLGEKGRQLISIAVAVTTRCDGCIVLHSDVGVGTFTCAEDVVNSL